MEKTVHGLEYAVAAWSPYTKEDKRILEKVKRRGTRVTKCLEGLSYVLRKTIKPWVHFLGEETGK